MSEPKSFVERWADRKDRVAGSSDDTFFAMKQKYENALKSIQFLADAIYTGKTDVDDGCEQIDAICNSLLR